MPTSPTDVQAAQVVLDATRALIRIETPDEATDVLVELVRRLGGGITTTDIARPDVIRVDLSLGQGSVRFPTALVGSAERELLERVLPSIVDDARHAASVASQLNRYRGNRSIDPLTGTLSEVAVQRLVARLAKGDVIVRLTLDGIEHVEGEHLRDARDRLVADFARTIQQELRLEDHLGRVEGNHMIGILRQTDASGAGAALVRIRKTWTKLREVPLTFSAGVTAVGSGGGQAAYTASRTALHAVRRAGGDGWASADPPSSTVWELPPMAMMRTSTADRWMSDGSGPTSRRVG